MAYAYKIMDGELTCKEYSGDCQEGWWKEDDKFSADSKAKAKSNYLASKPAPQGNDRDKKK